MNERWLILERSIEHNLPVLERLFDQLGDELPTDEMSQEELIVLGYRLHGIYNAFENIFLAIVRAQENSLDKQAGWHAELLSRMQIDLRPLRPPVIDQTLFEHLDELRRFRHLFRAAYSHELDPQRLAIVVHKARQLRELYPRQIETFLSVLGHAV